MASCPMTHHPDFVKLVNDVGELQAYNLWDKYEGDVGKIYSELNSEQKVQSSTNPILFQKENILGEALAKDNPELQEYILDHLQKTFPNVEVFYYWESFKDYCEKTFGSVEQVNFTILGAALGNAIFIDPEKAVQSTGFHEFAHLYWHTLPDNHPAKVALLEMFEDEEDAIVSIGIAGVDIAQVELKGTTIEKFLAALKDFWRAVKSIIGISSRRDLAHEFAKSVWQNRDGLSYINSRTIEYMKGQEGKDPLDMPGEKKESHIGVRSVISSFFPTGYKEDKELEIVANPAVIAAETGKPTTPEAIQKAMDDVQNRNEDTRNFGNNIDLLVGHTLLNLGISSDVWQMFENQRERDKAVLAIKSLAESIAGKEYTVEYQLDTSEKTGEIIGVIDIKLTDANGDFFIIDIKSKRYQMYNEDSTLNEKYTKSYSRRLILPFNNIEASQYNHDMLQVNMYANMEEERTGKRCLGVYILPVTYEYNQEGRNVKNFQVEKAIKMPREAKLADKMVKVWKEKQDLSHATTDEMMDPTIHPIMRKAIREARAALNAKLPEGMTLANAPYEHIRRLFSEVNKSIRDRLIDLGYSVQEMEKFDKVNSGTQLYSLIAQSVLPSKTDLDKICRLPTNEDIEITSGKKLGEEQTQNYNYTRKILTSILDEIGTLNNLENLSIDELYDIEQRIRKLSDTHDGRLLKTFHDYIRNEINFKRIAKEINRENKKDFREYPVNTLILFQYASDDASKDIRNLESGESWWVPDRIQEGLFNGYFIMQLKSAEIQYIDKVFNVRQLIKKYRKKIDINNVTYEGTERGKYYFKDVTNEQTEVTIEEREFVNEIIQFYLNNNPAFTRHYEKVMNQRKQAKEKYGSKALLNTLFIPMPAIQDSHKITPRYWFGKEHWQNVVIKLTKPQPYDDISITTLDGKKTTWLKFKMDYRFPIEGDLIQMKESVKELRRNHDEAKRIYEDRQKGVVGEKDLQRKIVHVPLFTSEHIMYTHKDKWGVLEMHLSNLAKKFEFERVVPGYEFIENIVNEFLKATSLKLDRLQKYLTGVRKYKLKYMTEEEDAPKWWKKFGNLIFSLQAWKSLAKNPRAQLLNFAIGQVGNFNANALAFYTGWKRAITNPKKFFAMLKRFGVLDLSSEFITTYQEKIGKNISFVMFIEMMFAEKLNHGVIFNGLLSKKQWDAYDNNANYISGKEGKITNQELMKLKDDTHEIHGDYGEMNKIIAQNFILFRMITQFRTWMFANYFLRFRRSQIDYLGHHKRGFYRSFVAYLSILKWNYATSKAKRREQIHDLSGIDPRLLVKKINYYKFASEEKDIHWNDMTPTDKANMLKFGKEMGAYSTVLALWLLTSITKHDDDEDEIWKWLRMSMTARFMQDVTFWLPMTNYTDEPGQKSWVEYIIAVPMPSLQYLYEVEQTISYLYLYIIGDKYARYQTKQPGYEIGDLKLWKHLYKILPGGTGISDVKFLLNEWFGEPKKGKRGVIKQKIVPQKIKTE